MNVTINVSKLYPTAIKPQAFRTVDGRYFHHFTVGAPTGGLPIGPRAKEVFQQLSAAFPSPDYKVEATSWESQTGRDLHWVPDVTESTEEINS